MAVFLVFLGAISRYPLQSFLNCHGLNPWQFKKGFPLLSGLENKINQNYFG
jgi:hypothetical protein